jgi:general secretion pathway protein L
METVNIRWNVELETWFVAEFEQQFEQQSEQSPKEERWLSFDEWASKKADLSAFRFILSGENYVCRWLTLPGVQPRHLNKALPFALEESFIEDVSQYHIVTAGKAGKFTHQIYCSKTDILERLLDACTLHHIQPRQLIPETSLAPANCMLHAGEYWLIKIAEVAEAKIHQSALITYLEAICIELADGTVESLTIIDKNLDAANLLKMQVETSFSDTFKTIEVQHGGFEQSRNKALTKDCRDLLTAQFRPTEIKIDKPAAWWKSAAILAACWAVFSFTQTVMENKQLIEQEKQVRDATVNLYKELFPGERVRFLERQIRTKIKGGNENNTAGFMLLLHKTSTVYQKTNQQKQIKWQSVRFNERQNLLVIDLTANTIADIQQFKSAIEKENLTVEISSATNENSKVKGRIKIGGQS